jgi:broad specificity phosphatase PhoE
MALRRPLATVVVVRHGSTDRNRGGVGMDQVRGHSDIPMTDGGRNEVRVTASVLADVAFELIYASDMQRALETAEIIADEQPQKWHVDGIGYPQIVAATALRSWDMGSSMEGRVTTPDVVEQIREWVRNDAVVPPGGESFQSYVGRVLGFVGPLFDRAAAERATLAIVTHGRTCQVIDFWVAAGCDEACMRRDFGEMLAEEPDNVPPGGGIRYKWDGLGWLGIVVPTGAASVGTQSLSRAKAGIMGGDRRSVPGDGVVVS